MDKYVLKAEKRKLTGRKVKSLRQEGILPANVFGKKIKSASIQMGADEFQKVYRQVGETGLLNLRLTGEKEDRPVLVANIQKEPVSDAFLHVDFHQVDLKEKVEARVPVELSGESPAEKQGIGTVVLYLDEIEVEALPTDLPEKFAVDVSGLAEVDQAIYVKDLPIDKKRVELKTEPDSILVKVEPPQKEEAVAPPPTEAAPAEGEAPVEGETPTAAEAPAGKPAEGVPAEPAKEEVKPEAKKP